MNTNPIVSRTPSETAAFRHRAVLLLRGQPMAAISGALEALGLVGIPGLAKRLSRPHGKPGKLVLTPTQTYRVQHGA